MAVDPTQDKPRDCCPWYNYVWQSLLAMGAVFVALMALTINDLLVVVSLAATSFTVYIMPGSVTSRPRNVVGGTLIGLFFGSCFALMPHGSDVSHLGFSAAAVGLSTFAMSVTGTEHPPAAGTALGVVTAGFSGRLVLGVILGVVIISLIQQALKPSLRDLTYTHPRRQTGEPPPTGTGATEPGMTQDRS